MPSKPKKTKKKVYNIKVIYKTSGVLNVQFMSLAGKKW